ncbi:MAG: phosphohistidine phosphatase SixA [Rhodocyclaceae bacterium]
MELILWRHAEAADGAPDEARVLTARGEKQARKVAAWLGPRLPARARILASPARRTVQTARSLGLKFATDPALAAGVQEALRAARWRPDAQGCAVLVGHQPTLGRIAALLLTGQERDLAIRKATLWWFDSRGRDEGSPILLRAVIGPDLA